MNARVGHLACSTKNGRPLVIPICFAFYGSRIYTAVDEKRKRTHPWALRRISNILANPNVCLVVDRYSDDWDRLWYVLIDGSATVISKGKEFRSATTVLRRKYPQYLSMRLENRPIIRIIPFRVSGWKAKAMKQGKTVKVKGSTGRG
jgi:PPOX class probable F420-dependent enzyme